MACSEPEMADNGHTLLRVPVALVEDVREFIRRRSEPWRAIRTQDVTEWPVRVGNALFPEAETLGALADMTERELRRLPNVGDLAVRSVADVLRRAKAGEDVRRPCSKTMEEIAGAN